MPKETPKIKLEQTVTQTKADVAMTQTKSNLDKKEKLSPTSQKLAAILVRGLVNIKKPLRDTLNLLKLNHKNHCVVIDNNHYYLGMLKKVKDYITWGTIDDATFQELVTKRGEEYLGPETDSKKKIKYTCFFKFNNKNYKKYFRLNPPRKGFGRKGIKMPFSKGGALGDRKEKINDIIKRML